MMDLTSGCSDGADAEIMATLISTEDQTRRKMPSSGDVDRLVGEWVQPRQ